MAIRLVGWDDARIPPFVLRAFAAARLSVETVEGVAATSALEAGAPIVVFYRPPADALRASLAAGAPPTEAVARWNGETRDLLDRSREIGERATLAPLATGEDAAFALLAALGAALGCALADPSPTEVDRAPIDASDTDVLLDLLAREALADPAARALCAELEAASLRLPAQALSSLASLDRAWLRLLATGGAAEGQERKDLSAARAREAEGRRANALLKAQVSFLQDELEHWRGQGTPATTRPSASTSPEAADAASYQEMLRDGLQPLRKALEARDCACEALERQVAELREQGRSASASLAEAVARRKNLEIKLLMASSRLRAQDMAVRASWRGPPAPFEAVAPQMSGETHSDSATS